MSFPNRPKLLTLRSLANDDERSEPHSDQHVRKLHSLPRPLGLCKGRHGAEHVAVEVEALARDIQQREERD